VTQRVRVDGLGDAGPAGGLEAGVPDDFVGDGFVAVARLQARKNPAVPPLQGPKAGPRADALKADSVRRPIRSAEAVLSRQHWQKTGIPETSEQRRWMATAIR
jgi:hypothetical protein